MRRRVLFEERSAWPWWVHLLILGAVGACLWTSLKALALGGLGSPGSGPAWLSALTAGFGVVLMAGFYLLMGDLRTRVKLDGVYVSFGRLGLIRKRIPFEEIEEARALTYSPLLEFGGWGIRMGKERKLAWTVRGNRAVRMDLTNGKVFYLGSDRPERLVEWIRSARRQARGEDGED